MSKTIIEINNLRKSFADNDVLKDVSMEIKEGDIYGLIGRSGAGKSTLLRCMNGLTCIDSGSLIVDGQNLNGINKHELRNLQKEVGMIFQNFALVSQKTVYDNIAMPMKHWGYSKEEIDRKVHELAEIVEISDKLSAYPGSLSGGQQQRVGIARALTLDPKIILSDEATSALDPVTTRSILGLLSKVNREMGITMVIVTHEISVVKNVCNKAAILEDGEIVVDDLVKEIFMEEPEALKRLISLKRDYDQDEACSRLKIKLYDFKSHDAIISDITKETGARVAIKDFKIDELQDGLSGYILVEIENEKLQEVQDYLATKNIGTEVI